MLEALGVPFRVLLLEVPETVLLGESPWQTARRLAGLKLEQAATLDRSSVILAADTTVELEGAALGKPRSVDEARAMLRLLRGSEHLVHTAIAARRVGFVAGAVCSTKVRMRSYDDSEIERYVATGEPLDKAGGYAIQDPTFRPVQEIYGLYSTVVGLPLGPTARLLSLVGCEVRLDCGADRYETGA